MEQSILTKVLYYIDKKVLNISLTVKVLDRGELHHRDEYSSGINSNGKNSLQSAVWVS